MYRILIKHNTSSPTTSLWKEYGTTTTVESVSTFTPFETENLDTLKEEINKLDKIYGYENIMAVRPIEYKISLEVEDAGDDDDIILDDDIVTDPTP